MSALAARSREPHAEWKLVRDIALDLADGLALARGGDRLRLARTATRDARAVLERMTGPEAETARMLLSSLEAANREIVR